MKQTPTGAALLLVLLLLIITPASQAGPHGTILVRELDSITIDGDVSDWPLENFETVLELPATPGGLEAETVDAQGDHLVFDIDRVGFFNGTEAAHLTDGGPGDFEASTYFAYDSEFFYILSVVIDEAVRGDRDTTEFGSSGFLNDGFEFLIDAAGDSDDCVAMGATFEDAEPNRDDVQITVALNENFLPENADPDQLGARQGLERGGNPLLVQAEDGEKNGPGGLLRDALDALDGPDIAARKTEDGYVIELRVPFGFIPEFTPDNVMKYTHFWNDFDTDEGPGGANKSWITWGQQSTVTCEPDEDPPIALFHAGTWAAMQFVTDNPLNNKPGPNISLRKQVNFGQLDIPPTVQELTIPVRNTGITNPLTIDGVTVSGADADHFTVVSFPDSLDPKATGDIVLSFDSQGMTGPYEAVLEVANDDVEQEDQARQVAITLSVVDPTGPLAHVKLDETEGTTLADSSGNQRGATVEAGGGTITLNLDPLASGKAIEVSGGGSARLDGTTFGPLESFSVSLWFQAADADGQGTLVSRGLGGSPIFAILQTGSNAAFFVNDGPIFSTEGDLISADTVHHLVATYDNTEGARRAAIFIDGVEAGVLDGATNLDDIETDPFWLGSFAGALGFSGRIDDFQYYNRTLTTDEIQTLRTNPGEPLRGVTPNGGGGATPDDPGTLPADSAADFGGPEVDNGWSYGYRNVDLANRTDDYDPVADFIEFPDDWWINDQWDEPNADGDNVPWTSIGATNGHPNGDNNGELHWTIRRWTSPGGPLDVTWSIAKENVACGNGVTGALHHNGVRIDSETLAFDDAVGVQRSVFLITEAGDVLDLIHSPFGTDGTDADGCDGALSSMSIAAGVPPVDGDVLDLLVLGADDTGETGADANVLAFLREVFGADNIRYMNSNATDGSETADVIIMSSTFGSGSVRGKFHNSAVPIVNWEEAVMDNGDGEFGQSTVVMTKSTDTFQMALSDHSIAGDLAGTTIDFFTGAGPETLGSSALSAGTTAVGTAVGGSIDGLAMLFVTDTGGVVDAGSGVVDGVSPARRVALPLTDASFDGLSDDGKQVFVNAIRWAAGAGGEDKAGIDGLLGYWRFDEGSGSTVADSSGNGNDGTIIEPGAAWVSDPGLGSVYQSGGGSYVELGTLPVIGVDTDFTWSFWVNAGETDNNNIVLGNRWSPDGTDFAPREFVKFTPRVFEWHVDGAGQNMPGDNSMFVVDEWAHNLVVKTGATLTYYRNGAEIATSEIVSAPANAQPLYLGGQNGAEIFTGKFDEVAIFGRALSTDEVTDVYNRGLNGESLTGGAIPPPPAPAPEITGVSKTAAGVALQFPAGTTYDIEYSTDLETWTLIASDVTDSYSDADAGRNAGAEGYYRGVVK